MLIVAAIVPCIINCLKLVIAAWVPYDKAALMLIVAAIVSCKIVCPKLVIAALVPYDKVCLMLVIAAIVPRIIVCFILAIVVIVPCDIAYPKPVLYDTLSGHSKIDKTKVLKSNGSVMKVESIAECSV